MRRVAPLLAALFWLACRTPTPDATEPGVPLAPDDPIATGRMLELTAAAAERRSMRGTLRLAVDAPDLQFRSTQRVAAERPARLRVEILGLFSQVAAVLTVDGGRFEYFDAATGRGETGTVDPGLLWNVARVDLAPGEAVALLLGGADPDPSLRMAGGVLRRDGALALRFVDAAGRVRQRLDFDPEGRLVRQENWDAVGRPTWQASFADHLELDGRPFAERVELRFPRTDARATVRFRGVELNPAVPPGLFSLDIPERVSSAPPGGGR